MFKPRHFLFSILSFLLLSCKNDHSYTYSIKDFRGPLQPCLVKIVSKGIVTYDSCLHNEASDEELLNLTRSEHPVLRASAYREILERNTFDHFDLLMNHLSDTAIVATDAGEFGIWYRAVSDDILQKASWRTEAARQITIEQVLTRHNYLRSAYTILDKLEPQEKYYTYIKDMATRPRRLSDEGYELGFDDIEYALYGLAKFKKQEDIKIIKDKMMQNVWKLSDISFKLMRMFPDTAYFDVLQAYHQSQFYNFTGNRPHGFSGIISDRASPEDFIRALVIQQNYKSAQLLNTMLNRLSLQTCMPGKENIIDELVMEIWAYPCMEYEPLREKIRPRVTEILGWRLNIPIDTNHIQAGTTEENIGWHH